MHRLRTLSIPLILLMFWVACDGTLLYFPVADSAETTIAQGSLLENLVGDLGFGEFLDMDITQSQEFQNQGAQPGDVQDVHLVRFKLEVLDPAGADLSFLDSMEIYVESPGLDRVRVAYAPEFPAGETGVEFEIDDVDLTEYIVSQSVTLSTEVSGHRPEQDTQVKASYELNIGITAQGACNAIEGS